jgi:hypothetical protein
MQKLQETNYTQPEIVAKLAEWRFASAVSAVTALWLRGAWSKVSRGADPARDVQAAP